MKIIGEATVLVLPKETFGESLSVCLGKSALKNFDFAGRKLLRIESPGAGAPYEREMALVVLGKNTPQEELYSFLKEAGFYPAGLNQTAHYIKKLSDGKEKIPLGPVIVLGMGILDDDCKEVHLVIKKDGVERETAYPEKPIRQRFQVVVIKEEKSVRKK